MSRVTRSMAAGRSGGIGTEIVRFHAAAAKLAGLTWVKGGAVTPEMTLRLELAFGASAQSWLGHQPAYDLWQVEQERTWLAKLVRRVEVPKAA